MAALTEGKIAPTGSLQALDGSNRTLRPSQPDGLLVLAFTKRSCPVCQFTMPFLETVHRAYAGDGVEVVGISQDDRDTTRAFVKECGLTLPYLLDGAGYPVSSAYGLTNVPTLFLIDGAGKILVSSVGFAQPDIIEISKQVARRRGVPLVDPFAERDDVPQFRPG